VAPAFWAAKDGHCGAGAPPAGGLPLSVTIIIVPATRPSAPAFWAAPGDPAAHKQRGHSVGIGRTVTTLPARAAASN